MTSLIVQHTVKDYDTWRRVFDEHETVRTRHGATGHELYRSLNDPNEVTIVNRFPSREQADAFASDPSLKEAMERGGVTSAPRVTFAGEPEVADYRQSERQTRAA
jgi:heme-degrading monooxygenase HmoA